MKPFADKIKLAANQTKFRSNQIKHFQTKLNTKINTFTKKREEEIYKYV